MKQTTKKYIGLSLLLYVLILALALTGTLAWFIFDRRAGISSSENGKITVGENIEVCLDDGDDDASNDEWGMYITLDDIKSCPDVSYDPASNTWWYPTDLNDKDVPEYTKPDTFSTINDESGYYITIKLKFRTSSKMELYLNHASTVSGLDMEKKDDKTGTFSRDAIAGAARVGVWTDEGLKTVWIPNELYELTFDANGNVTGFNANGKREDSYKYLALNDLGTAMEERIWDTQAYHLSVGSQSLATDTTIGNATPLLSFDDSDTLVEKKLTLRIWIEGTDRESNSACAGGQIKYDIKFIGHNKSESTVAIDDVKYSAGQLVYASTGEVAGSELAYSYDSQTWAAYNPTNPDLLNGHTEIYIRAAETATQKSGAVKKLTVTA